MLADQSYYPDVSEQKLGVYPNDMTKWTFQIANIIQPTWAQDNRFESLDSAISAVKRIMRTARNNGCSGFKSIQGYFREFYLEDVDESEAEESYRVLKKSKPTSFLDSPAKVPLYKNKRDQIALKRYQDFFLKTAFCAAGEMRTPMLIHVAVGEVPQLKPWNNDPVGLYSIFENKEIEKSNAQFVLLHTGFPAHHIVSSIITQYPNVAVDLSWMSHATVLTHAILAEYLAVAPPQKILHGSDGSHPDVIAFAARSTKKSLSMIARWLSENYGWTAEEVTKLAEAVLYQNAERIFGKI